MFFLSTTRCGRVGLQARVQPRNTAASAAEVRIRIRAPLQRCRKICIGYTASAAGFLELKLDAGGCPIQALFWLEWGILTKIPPIKIPNSSKQSKGLCHPDRSGGTCSCLENGPGAFLLFAKSPPRAPPKGCMPHAVTSAFGRRRALALR